MALEPMNPYERRIIHSSLQNEKYITTYSEGEEPYRKVVVALKKDENGVDLLKEERFEKGGRGRNSRNGKGGRGGRRGRDYRGSKNSSRSSDNTSDHIILTTDITYESRTVTSGSNKVSSSNTGERSFIPLWITIACSAVAIIGTLIFMKIRKKSE